MFHLPGFTIGDSWFVVRDGVAHGFFCTSPEPRPSWNWDIGHAVSRDLVHWRFLGFALERGAGESWDSQTLSTGSVLAWKGRYWMAYSALRRGENPPTRKVHRVGLAVSDDLYSWTKCAQNPVNERDPRHYERLGPVHRAFGQWRDPFLFQVEGPHLSAGVRQEQAPGPRPTGCGWPGDQRRHADVAGGAAAARGPNRHRDRGPAGVPHRRTVLPVVLHLGRPHRPVVPAPVTRAIPFATPTSRWSASHRWGRFVSMAPARCCRRTRRCSPMPAGSSSGKGNGSCSARPPSTARGCICDPIPVVATATGHQGRVSSSDLAPEVAPDSRAVLYIAGQGGEVHRPAGPERVRGPVTQTTVDYFADRGFHQPGDLSHRYGSLCAGGGAGGAAAASPLARHGLRH